MEMVSWNHSTIFFSGFEPLFVKFGVAHGYRRWRGNQNSYQLRSDGFGHKIVIRRAPVAL